MDHCEVTINDDAGGDDAPFVYASFYAYMAKIWAIVTLYTIGIVASIWLNGCIISIIIADYGIGYQCLAFDIIIVYVILLMVASILLYDVVKSYKISKRHKKTITSKFIAIILVLILIFYAYDILIPEMLTSDQSIVINNTNITNITNSTNGTNINNVCHVISGVTNMDVLIAVAQIYILAICICMCISVNFANSINTVNSFIYCIIGIINYYIILTAFNTFANNLFYVCAAITCILFEISWCYACCKYHDD